MKRNDRDYCLMCGHYFVGLAQDCKCTGDGSGGRYPYDEPLTETVMRCVSRWLKASWQSVPLDVGGKYAKTLCAICGKKGEDHTHIGNYKPEGYKPSYMIRIWRWFKAERTITRWEYWMIGIGSGITASALTTFIHWLES